MAATLEKPLIDSGDNAHAGGKSVWEMPISIDYTCGQAKSVPPHAEEPILTFPRANTMIEVQKL